MVYKSTRTEEVIRPVYALLEIERSTTKAQASRIKDLEEELEHAMVVQSEKDAEIAELKTLLSQAVEGLERIEKHARISDKYSADWCAEIAREVLATLQTDKRLDTEVKKYV